MLTATIEVPYEAEEIYRLFSLEDKTFQNKRSSYECKKIGNKAVFKIKATDSVALRSVLNTITKILTVYEKTIKVLEDE